MSSEAQVSASSSLVHQEVVQQCKDESEKSSKNRYDQENNPEYVSSF